MAGLSRRRAAEAEDDEGYFVSMSDMLTGLLFVFIILLLYFALQFREDTERLTGANAARAQLLEAVKERLREQGLVVEIDTTSGVLRLPDNILFASGQSDLTPEGREAVGKVAGALAAVLPCYAEAADGLACKGRLSEHRVDALFVEGHTDRQRLMRGGRDTNIDLSTQRAINTYLALLESEPRLDALASKPVPDRAAVPILSVSGYGPRRPVPGHEGDSETDLKKNRRIDLRILMVTPQTPESRDMLLRGAP